MTRLRPFTRPFRWLPRLAALAYLLGANPATAGNVPASTDLATVHALALSFLQSQSARTPGSKIVVSPPDRRLRLPACNRPLEAFLPPGSRAEGHVTVGVCCTGDHPWRVFMKATVARPVTLYTWRRTLAKGSRVTPGDLQAHASDTLHASRNALIDPAYAQGAVLRRKVLAGETVQRSVLKRVPEVRRGQQVKVIYRSGAVEISATAIAMTDGAVGDHLRVRNQRSNKLVEAVVVAAGKVEAL